MRSLRSANRNPALRLPILELGADSTELTAESVDVAFICDTYHHFEFPLKTMASLHKALRPGGRVMLIDFRRDPDTSTQWVMSHVRAGQEVIESEMVQAGFRKTREIDGMLKENYFVEFTKGPSPGLKPLEFPIIAGYGGVVRVPNAVEKPRSGAKIVFDVTSDAKPGEVNKGLDRAARILNLYGAAGFSTPASGSVSCKLIRIVQVEKLRHVLPARCLLTRYPHEFHAFFSKR